MFSINYSHTNYPALMRSIASQMNAVPANNILFIPEHIATGYYKFFPLSNGLQCLITNCKLNQDLYVFNNHTHEEFYTLRFVELSVSKNLMLKIDEEYVWEGKQEKALVILTSSLFDFAFLGSKGSAIRSINVLISREWLAKYLGLELGDDVLKKYLALKTDSYNFASFDVEYKSLFNMVLEDSGTLKKNNSAIERNITIMVERFLYQLHQKLNFIKEKDKIKIRYDEVKRLMEVESYLVKDFSTLPPSISYLSRVAAMSTTSLKNKFKKLYGNTVYEYFQKSRMQRAKVLLLTHKYSIKEIGSQLGYTNLSNFTIAFKKEFNRLPSQLSM